MNETVHPAYVEPVRKSIRVQASAERAFEVFTSGMSRWWIRTCTVNPAKAAIERVVMEPRPGGRWFEVGVDGSECDWGRVLVWEPYHRLVLDWQIAGNFEPDPNLHTEVEVRFIQHPSGATDVTLEHRQLERYGELAAKLKESLSGGWGGLLDQFAKAAQTVDV